MNNLYQIEAAISAAEDLYIHSQECSTEDWHVIVAGDYDSLVSHLGLYCAEFGVTITADQAHLATPDGTVMPAARFQLVNNPMKRMSRTKIQYVLERLGFYLIAQGDSPALMVVGPETTTVYSKHEFEEDED
jgi:hypothetical protein